MAALLDTMREAFRTQSALHQTETDEEPLRAELFSVDQLTVHAKAFAANHQIGAHQGDEVLISRLLENERILISTYDALAEAVAAEKQITPAAEWLLDNFYLIEEQIHTARRHLPPAYGRSLPRLMGSWQTGFPRVYSIALELIAHVDGGLDMASLDSFVRSYQTVTPLTIGELWAIPIMLRLALLENLRRVAVRLSATLRDRDSATDWAEKMVRVVDENPSNLVLVLADMSRADIAFTSAFIAELMRHLHGRSPHFAFAHSWIEHRLSDQGMTTAQLVQLESFAQVADQKSIGNSITSLRFLSATDWRDFIEEQSLVDRTLRNDPAEVYGEMDFVTRNAYRAVVETMARDGALTEVEIAEQAVLLASEAASQNGTSRLSHVGYYLLGNGQTDLEVACGVRSTVWRQAAQWIRHRALRLYLGGIFGCTALVMVFLLALSLYGGIAVWSLALLLPLALLCTSHFSVGLINWLSMMLVTPRPLPRLDFRSGISEQSRTIVVVPTMLGDGQSIRNLLERIEVHYVANPERFAHFALLTDFVDAPEKVMPGDEAQVRQVSDGIRELNLRYADGRGDIFFLLHRPRCWNAMDEVWMGRERKRGKLEDLNFILRGGSTERFMEVIGDTSLLQNVRYVITLDTDTQLPRDGVRGLVGTMAHPLNRPEFDVATGCVVEGYGILQPRVATSLPTASLSWFVRLYAGDSGLDPYTREVSDVYQDLFGEGSFIGKGIYDVDAFRRTCEAFPENMVLSHDLLEGNYARSGLLTSIELYEEHPSSYAVDAKRRHRWIRGDWQIARWLLPTVPSDDGGVVPNPLSSLSRWKIVDNLLRSLVPPAMLLLLVCAWLLPSSALAIGASLFVIALLSTLPLFHVAMELGRKTPGMGWQLHLRTTRPAIGRRTAQVAFALTMLLYEACLNLDAMIRTLTRMLWSHRRMLEWTTSSDSARSANTGFFGLCRSMALAPLISACLIALVALVQPANLYASVPILTLWFLSPVAAWLLSRRIVESQPELTTDQVVYLRAIARKTWRYFEMFTTEEENWLPPDNFQERPAPMVASRTSPTNIGVGLLANLSAYDFGYESAGRFLERTQQTLGTMGRLERYRGHFYNWYETHSLTPMRPMYISTVDSGNLSMSLLVLQRGLLEMMDASVVPARMMEGVQDTLRVYTDEVEKISHSRRQGDSESSLADVVSKAHELSTKLERIPSNMPEVYEHLDSAEHIINGITDNDCNLDSVIWWGEALRACVKDHRAELSRLAPWIGMSLPPDSLRMNGATSEDEAINALHLLLEALTQAPTLRQVAQFEHTMLPGVDRVAESLRKRATGVSSSEARWMAQLRDAVREGSTHAEMRLRALQSAADECEELSDMDFTFLYDESRNLMSIGYNMTDNRLDAGSYDLLATEARVASYLAIAHGQVGQEHWFALRRMLTTSNGLPALLSWNGSMFEYLMPLLLMPTFNNTLLDETYKAVVQRQVNYGKRLGIPWGVSESGYNMRDIHHTYQYRGFGVPGLGLKRGLVEDRVVAPYATMLALMIDPLAACQNLERLSTEGQEGAYGFYEAIDYTPTRVPRGSNAVTVWSFMVHHQGMSLLSLEYLLLDRPMQRRFNANPALRATELLLHERIPRLIPPIYPHAMEVGATHGTLTEAEAPIRVITDPSAEVPEIHLLSNGRYHVMVSSAGGGYSRWGDFAVTRWREDTTRDCWGSFCYLRDLDTGRFWSVGHQPTLKRSDPYEAVFGQGKAEFFRRDEQIEVHTEISVSPEDDIELRRTTITNRSERSRTIEVTSYAEVVLAPPSQDATHPAFSNLFVQTELLRPLGAILCTRRPRSAEERPPWMTHLLTVNGESVGDISFETSRANFIGRGRTVTKPEAMDNPGPLSNTEGYVLDPIVSIRHMVRLKPGESTRIDIVTGITDSREATVALAEKYHDPRLSDRVYEMAWTHSQVELRHINATESDAQLYLRLAGSVIYAASRHRAHPEVLRRNRRSQSGLWGQGISGDLPIVLIRIRDREQLDIVLHALQAHAYWRSKGLVVDLVIWNEDNSVYRQELFETILDRITASPDAGLLDKPGGVYLRRVEQITEEDRLLLLAAARVVLTNDEGTFREQVEPPRRPELAIPLLPSTRRFEGEGTVEATKRQDLVFFNGLGGFTKDGREYITVLDPGQVTPAPWCNVIANPTFGTLVSESGSVYTWADNSHEYRLTPWENDPISNVCGEAFYIRDEDTGRMWSPTPQPARGANTYVTRHGFGYSIYEYQEDGIHTELTIFVAVDAPVKFVRLKIWNRSGRPRRLTVTGYWELVLGELRPKSHMHVVTEIDLETGAVFAHNAYSTEYGGRVAFFDTSEPKRLVTGDRSEFLGRNGSPSDPAALHRSRLSGRVGAGYDPCVALQVTVQLEVNAQRDLAFSIGSASSEEECRDLVQRHRGVGRAQEALESVWRYWEETLGTVHVETPDDMVNFMVNGWLPYQTISCRMWGRTGFYQSGGAFGFRDQLQDSMSLIHAAPGLLREHLLRAAARQFVEGDVQHWWHAHSGRGVRTHFSDDYLWLPYSVCRYVRATGDTGVLDEMIPFLEGRPVRADEEGYYDLPNTVDGAHSLYEHCVRAIKNGLTFGEHGLPLMGCGDWNDGMNLVGEHGKGESVWLAFFLYDVLMQFARLAHDQQDEAFSKTCAEEAEDLAIRIDKTAWDGKWYRRAYFDDGQPLGSAENIECQIDSIAQSWAVLTGAGNPERARQAMESVDERLVCRDASIIRLFKPPFDKADLNPGYIKGYSPGVRENGGQYTHAAIWTAMAFAALNDPHRAWEMVRMLNPISHGNTPEAIQIYGVEPYVVAADVYGCEPHTGRGGWTWYTGSSSWMYRLMTESLLGLHLEVDTLRFTPCHHPDWESFIIHYRYRGTHYHITVHRGSVDNPIPTITLDGAPLPGTALPLVDDHCPHTVQVRFD